MGVHTHETRIIKAIHGHLHRTDSNTLIIILSDHVANRHTDRILTDAGLIQCHKTNMVKDKTFGELEWLFHTRETVTIYFYNASRTA